MTIPTQLMFLHLWQIRLGNYSTPSFQSWYPLHKVLFHSYHKRDSGSHTLPQRKFLQNVFKPLSCLHLYSDHDVPCTNKIFISI